MTRIKIHTGSLRSAVHRKVAVMKATSRLIAAALLISLMKPCYGEVEAVDPAASIPSSSIGNAAPHETVVIQGIGSVYTLNYAKLLLAKSAFSLHRDKAPSADLFFEVNHLQKGSPPTRLSLEVGEESVSIPVIDEDKFFMPELTINNPERAVIIANRKSTQIAVRPVVRTRNLAPDRLRLGDLRASCEAIWAMEREDVSLAIRAAFVVAGGVCKSPKIAIGFPLKHRAQSATLIDNNTPIPVRLSRNGDRIFPPISDTSLSNDAMIVLVLKQPDNEASGSPMQ